MSIDARVKTVIVNEDGSGELRLIDRPKGEGMSEGTAGQRALKFDKAPHEVTALNGLDIWGGANSVILGDVEIAQRQGYTTIVFHSAEVFKKAVTEYNKKVRTL